MKNITFRFCTSLFLSTLFFSISHNSKTTSHISMRYVSNDCSIVLEMLLYWFRTACELRIMSYFLTNAPRSLSNISCVLLCLYTLNTTGHVGIFYILRLRYSVSDTHPNSLFWASLWAGPYWVDGRCTSPLS